MSDENHNNGGYKVGRGRPPKHTQFKPGQSGNPKGRPPKSRELNTMFRKELDKTIVVTEGGREKRITKREALVSQVVNRAIKGDPKAVQITMTHLQNNREVEPFVSTEADDAELMRALSQSGTAEEIDDGTA